MTYLPDTNACITLLRRRNANLMARWQAAKASEVVVCSVVVYELRHGLILVTHNTREFERILGLKMEDWEP